MTIITAPNNREDLNVPSIFLAGGISNCADWQSVVAEKLEEKYGNEIEIINPRRVVWDDDRKDNEVSREQILWERSYIKDADTVIFWFSKETLCPITLFELGSAIHEKDIAVIGIDPEYQRKFDIEIQVPLVANIPIVYSIDDLIEETIKKIDKIIINYYGTPNET